MLENFIDLFASFSPMWDYFLFLLQCFFFIVTVPCIVRQMIQWR